MATTTTTTTVLETTIHKTSSISSPPKPPTHRASIRKALSSSLLLSQIIWAFIKDDVPAFVLPSSLFGVLGALASSAGLTTGPAAPVADVLARAPLVVLFNLANILVWDLSNQRAPEAVKEDRVNKPWRPIPSGRVTSNQTRRAVLVALPLVLLLNYTLGVHVDGLLLLVFCWYYNDLKGSDEFCREAVISLCYTLTNKISLQIALGPGAALSFRGYAWIGTVTAVALSTMHLQDLKDQEGDRLRARVTVPLVLGDQPARAIVALLLPTWSCACGYVWGNGKFWVCLPFAVFLAHRVWVKRTPKDDSKSWKLWCLWHMSLFFLPLMGGAQV
jgi:4-hydroxybenzoate polyprenyltransferase